MAMVHSLHVSNYTDIVNVVATISAAIGTIIISLQSRKAAEQANEISKISVKISTDSRLLDLAEKLIDGMDKEDIEKDISVLYTSLVVFDQTLNLMTQDKDSIITAKTYLWSMLPSKYWSEICEGEELKRKIALDEATIYLGSPYEAEIKDELVVLRGHREHVVRAFSDVASRFGMVAS